jgi:arylsulfatase
MTFNGALDPARRHHPADMPVRQRWVLSLIEPVIIDFDKTLVKHPNIKRSPGGASNDVVPNLRPRTRPLVEGHADKIHVGGGGG